MLLDRISRYLPAITVINNRVCRFILVVTLDIIVLPGISPRLLLLWYGVCRYVPAVTVLLLYSVCRFIAMITVILLHRFCRYMPVITVIYWYVPWREPV